VIDFELPDELVLLRDAAARFARAELAPREREHESARDVAPEVRERFEKTGLSRLDLPEALGGAGLGALARALVLEELAAADAGAALALDPLGPALPALAELGESALRELAAPLLAAPGARAVLVWDLDHTFECRDDRLWGEVPWVPADRADLGVVLRDREILVVRDGLALERLRGSGLRAAGASALRFEAARIVARRADAPAAVRARAGARLRGAALLVGVMRAAADLSRAYALQRVAFGRPIAHHQALAFLIADLASAVEGSRLLVWEAAARLERGRDAGEACASAFLECAEQAMFVAPNALQLLGGHGYMQDHPVEKWMRESRALGLLFGGVDAAREEAGAELAASASPVELTVAEG
jgi:alkylation response protein AidB-like acyl-CoA dehydrogenase